MDAYTTTCGDLTVYVSGYVYTHGHGVQIEAYRICGQIQQRVTVTREIAAVIKADPRYAGLVTATAHEAERVVIERAEREARAAAIVQGWDATAAQAERDGTPSYFRFGALPRSGRSHNHRDNRAERGVSVYSGWVLPGGDVVIDMRQVDDISGAFIAADRPLYRVTGDPCGTGSDGEPLLSNCAARKVRAGRAVTYLGAPYLS